MSARFALRAATAEAHGRVDALFSDVDLTDLQAYARFLTIQAQAHLAIESALEAAGTARVVADWPARRRSEALRTDLAQLGVADVRLEAAPRFETEAQVLGGVYVLEGSRLGGALLRRSAPADGPTAFLSPGRPDLWRSFIAMLDERLLDDDAIDDAVEAALAVFAVFEISARRALKDPAS